MNKDRCKIPNNGQKNRVLKTLLEGVHLSELEAIKRGLGTSMRSRISELRAEGYDIDDYRPTGTYKASYISPANIKVYKRLAKITIDI